MVDPLYAQAAQELQQLQSGLIALFLWLMGGSAQVNEAVETYFHIRIWGAPAALAGRQASSS